MRILHQELAKCLTRAGPQSETEPARPSLRSQWHSHGHSASWIWSPLSRPWGAELTEKLREETPMRQSCSRRRQTHPRERSRLRWQQSPSPPHPIWHQSPSPPFPPMSGWAMPWNSSTCIRGCVSLGEGHGEVRPPLKRHQRGNRFDADEELGDKAMLPTDLTHFLVEDKGWEWDNAPSFPTPEPRGLPQPSHSQPTYMAGARPKVPNKPSADQLQSRHREEPDLVNYLHRWIEEEMSQLGIHHAPSKRRCRAIRRIFQEVVDADNDFQVWYYASWQVVAFRLPATQQEVSWWWDAPPWTGGFAPSIHARYSCLQPQGLLGHEAAVPVPDLGTTGLCWGIGGPTHILCCVTQELQRCMAHLMTLCGENIAMASLLKPTKEEHGTSPTLEEEATFLGKETEPPQAPGVESAEQITVLRSPSPPSAPWPDCCPSQGQWSLWRELMLTQISLADGSTSTSRSMIEC